MDKYYLLSPAFVLCLVTILIRVVSFLCEWGNLVSYLDSCVQIVSEEVGTTCDIKY